MKVLPLCKNGGKDGYVPIHLKETGHTSKRDLSKDPSPCIYLGIYLRNSLAKGSKLDILRVTLYKKGFKHQANKMLFRRETSF